MLLLNPCCEDLKDILTSEDLFMQKCSKNINKKTRAKAGVYGVKNQSKHFVHSA